MFYKWFVLSVKSGLENKSIESLRKDSIRKNMLHYFESFACPDTNLKNSDYRCKIFSGYILVRFFLNNKSWLLIKKSNYVSKLLFSAFFPKKIRIFDIRNIIKEIKKNKMNRFLFFRGEEVKITKGPFETFKGIITEVSEEKKRVKLIVSIFSRDTPVYLNFEQIKKI